MSADGDIVRKAHAYLTAHVGAATVESRWQSEQFVAALARLEAAEERVASQAFRRECADTPLMRDVMAQRDALAEALRKIASPQEWKQGDGAPFEIARAALAEAWAGRR